MTERFSAKHDALLRCILSAALLAAAQGRGAGAETKSQPAAPSPTEMMDQVGIDPQLGESLPLDVPLTDSAGRAVRLGECLQGRPVILHLVYFECPMLCRLASDGLLSALSTLQLELGEDYDVVTLSFDPREGPDLAAKAKRMALQRIEQGDAAEAWHFLTGEKAAIDAVCQSVGFRYAYDPARAQYAHASGVFVLTPEGQVSRFLGGVDFSPRDLRLAVVDASAGTVGGVTDHLLLMCYAYDPAEGKYGFAVMAAVRLGGLATLAMLGGFIVVMIRRDRTRRRDDAPGQGDLQNQHSIHPTEISKAPTTK